MYNLLCDSLEIEPRPNNGTLHLPLKPVGLHSDPDAPTLEDPNDLPATSAAHTQETHPTSPATSAAPHTQTQPTSTHPTPSAPIEGPEKDPNKDTEQDKSLFDDFIDTISSLGDWITDLFNSG